MFDDSLAGQLLAWSGAFWVAWVNAQFEAGADVAVVTEGMAAATMTTRALFKEKCLPHTRACYAEANSPLVFHPTGGRINHMIDLVPGLPHLAGIGISSRDDLHEARRKAGPGIPLLGNIDNLCFRSVSSDQIRGLATQCLEAGEQIGPFILCNSGADLPIDTPPENIHALREAAEAFAARPDTAHRGETRWIVCGVLHPEMAELHRRRDIRGELCFLDSMLHMDPPRLGERLRPKLAETNRPTVLVYGDCCPCMLQLANQPGVGKAGGINCCQLLLGKARYSELMKEEAFMLLPEWAPRWREIIENELGLSGEVARAMLTETQSILVYLDTGLEAVPQGELEACSAYTSLPLRVERVGLDHLLDALRAAEAAATKTMGTTNA